MDFRKRYVAYLNRLQTLARKHDELTDTDVRERLYEVINYFFIWDKPMAGFPRRFAMMSDGADRAIAAATRAFILDARKLARKERVAEGAARHALIEDNSAKSRDGRTYDVYLGSLDEVARARKPGADSIYAPDKSATHGERPRYDPQDLAIVLRGKTIVPRFDPKSGMYEYASPGGHLACYAQEFYEPKDMRDQARASLMEDVEESRRLHAEMRHKIQSRKISKRKAECPE